MSKIVTLTVTVPADEEVQTEEVKAALQAIISEAGIRMPPPRPQPDGSPTLPGIAAPRMFFLAAGVKIGRAVAATKPSNGRKASPAQ